MTTDPDYDEIERLIDNDPIQLGRRLRKAEAERDALAQHLDTLKALRVTTDGHDRVIVAAPPDAGPNQAPGWGLGWDKDTQQWTHAPSGTSGTLGQMLYGIASCYERTDIAGGGSDE